MGRTFASLTSGIYGSLTTTVTSSKAANVTQTHLLLSLVPCTVVRRSVACKRTCENHRGRQEMGDICRQYCFQHRKSKQVYRPLRTLSEANEIAFHRHITHHIVSMFTGIWSNRNSMHWRSQREFSNSLGEWFDKG